MEIKIGDDIVEVIVIKKIKQKNTYLRFKDDLKLYVTTSSFVSDRKVKDIIDENSKSIVRMYNKQKIKVGYRNNFSYLGKEYDIVKTNSKDIIFADTKIFVPISFDLNKWLKKEANVLFKERLDYWYNNFTYDIPYPTLTIRKMTSRWGVCNSKLKRVTLNLELIKKDIACLDYVIVHELSHFIHMNHSKDFWLLVKENYPNYKEIRKIMKDY